MMPVVDCMIEAFCEINPSEDPQKIQQAMSNVLDGVEFNLAEGSIKASSDDLTSLSKIHESIQNRNSHRVYMRFLSNNLDGNTTWFYLNKQAAFANSISICEHDDESPLGPIKIMLRSKNIERVIEWLTAQN